MTKKSNPLVKNATLWYNGRNEHDHILGIQHLECDCEPEGNEEGIAKTGSRVSLLNFGCTTVVDQSPVTNKIVHGRNPANGMGRLEGKIPHGACVS
jgi:hypothetical protein